MTKVFADSAHWTEMITLNADKRVSGFTTNPSLLKQAGIDDYPALIKDVLHCIKEKPVCFEVLADDYDGVYREGMTIAGWGANAVVKVPCYNTQGKAMSGVIRQLALAGVTVNVTAVTTWDRVDRSALDLGDHRGYISIFAGRIADTGRNPNFLIQAAVELVRPGPIEIIWASPREVYNYYEAEALGCHVITMTPELIRKLDLRGKPLGQVCMDTVRQFHEDGRGFKL
jgi:transaldolase